MRISTFASKMMQSGNGGQPCNIYVVSEDIQNRYATEYKGAKLPCSGFSGVVNQIPAYLGNCTVKHIEAENSVIVGWRYKLYI